ncbi:hypothetical protein VARIO8X_20351 [Burkholderiales bacterium 8X]|nr:hypothetical protein VARIO8X_20351 [Burkholderiales bacterium 8X]
MNLMQPAAVRRRYLVRHPHRSKAPAGPAGGPRSRAALATGGRGRIRPELQLHAGRYLRPGAFLASRRGRQFRRDRRFVPAAGRTGLLGERVRRADRAEAQPKARCAAR